MHIEFKSVKKLKQLAVELGVTETNSITELIDHIFWRFRLLVWRVDRLENEIATQQALIGQWMSAHRPKKSKEN